jgi:hypothetical protein
MPHGHDSKRTTAGRRNWDMTQFQYRLTHFGRRPRTTRSIAPWTHAPPLAGIVSNDGGDDEWHDT